MNAARGRRPQQRCSTARASALDSVSATATKGPARACDSRHRRFRFSSLSSVSALHFTSDSLPRRQASALHAAAPGMLRLASCVLYMYLLSMIVSLASAAIDEHEITALPGVRPRRAPSFLFPPDFLVLACACK